MSYFSATSVVVAVAIAAGSTVQALAGAAAIKRWVGVSQIFESGPATLMFTGLAAAACLIASTWGVASLNVAGVVRADQFLDSWQTWWLGDLIGIVVFAPVFLTWRQSLQVSHKPWRLGELIAAFTLLALTTLVVFLAPAPGAGVTSPLTFLPLPCLVWIAFRFPPERRCARRLPALPDRHCSHCERIGTLRRRAHQRIAARAAGLHRPHRRHGADARSAVTGRRQSENALRSYSVEMEQLALTDELTGLRNRRGFLVLADQALRMARRTRAKCALVFVDLDGLKRVNDTRGHAAGDALIADAARVLGNVFRESDVVGRVGGDEFAVFALLDDHDGPAAVSGRLQAEIERFNAQVVPTLRVGMSIGIEEIDCAAGTPLDVLLSRADRAMYERKRGRA